jgi:hypothetical protein
MIGSNATVDRLLASAKRFAAATFTLPAREWNAAIEAYRSSRPLIIKGDYTGGWLHPWKITPRWNGEAWALSINPGFVSGVDAEVRMPRTDAPEETLARDTGDDRLVFAHLTEDPSIVVPLDLLRTIGPGAQATGTVGDPSAMQSVFEPVPAFFSALGVGDPPSESFDLNNGMTIGADFLNQEALNERRLLRALDVVLTKDRPAVGVNWTVSDALIDGSVAQFDLTYSKSPTERDRARVSFTRKFEPTPEPNVVDLLIGNATDVTFDQLHLATVYFLSPPRTFVSEPVDATWRVFVKHRVFWNLNHAANRLPVAPPPTPVTFPFPLAGGVATMLINSYLAIENDLQARAAGLLRAGLLNGRFWSA